MQTMRYGWQWLGSLLMLLALTGCGEDAGSSFDSTKDNHAPQITKFSTESISTDGTTTFTYTVYDADGDTVDLNVSATYGSAVFDDFNQSIIIFTPSVDYDGESNISIGMDDGNGGAWTYVYQIRDTPNIVPVLNNASLSISESAATGAVVGAISILDSGDSAISSIDLNGTGASNFLVSTSGVVTVAGGAALDYESRVVYALQATATSSAGTSVPVDVIINIIDEADEVPVLQAETASVREDAAAGALIDTITIDSVGDRAITAITLTGTGAANFTVGTDGTIRVASGASLDYETATSYALYATASSASGNSDSVAVTISVIDVPDVLPVIAASSGNVDEDASAGDLVGSINVTTQGDTPVTSMSLSGTGSNLFTVSATGAVSVAAGATFDFETTTSYSLTVTATNSAGTSTAVALSIVVNNVPDVVAVLTGVSGSVEEDAAAGTVAASIGVTEGDSSVTQIVLSGSGQSLFVASVDGTVTVAPGAVFDYETTTSYTLSATAYSAAGASNTVNVTIAVNDVAGYAAPYGGDLFSRVPMLVVGVNFSDAALVDDAYTWNAKLFGTAVGELNDYFDEVSYGAFALEAALENEGTENDGIVTITLPMAHPGNVDFNSTVLVSALSAADEFVDFAGYDSNGDGTLSRRELQLLFVIAGGEVAVNDDPATAVLAKSGALGSAPEFDGVSMMDAALDGSYMMMGERHGSHGATIGIVAHELGHALFELPDLYDSDGSSAGIGYFGLMGHGFWGKKALEDAGATPVHPCAWTKLQLGWGVVSDVTAEQYNVELNATHGADYGMIRFSTSDPSVYYLVENRSGQGYDAGLYALEGSPFGGGVAIWKIDESRSDNDDETAKRVDLLEADGTSLDLNADQRGEEANLYFADNVARFEDTEDGITVENISAQGSAGSAYLMTADFLP